MTRPGLEVRDLRAGEESLVEALAESVGLSLSVARERARPESRLLVAASTSGLSGFLSAWSLPPELEILDVGVALHARRAGIGRALVTEALRRASLEGALRVFLEVRPTNGPALGLYRSLGFEQFDQRRRYYADGEDAWVLRRELEGSERVR